MGFRSKMMTEEFQGIQVPDWFISKHPRLHYGWDWYKPTLSISSRSERKFYSAFKDEELFTDLQKVLVEAEYTGTLSVVLLHECGGITLLFITQTSIQGREPTAWKEVEQVGHDYCYDCSKPPAPTP